MSYADITARALADADNRGKLNLAEFHVAMGLIYRSESRIPARDVANSSVLS